MSSLTAGKLEERWTPTAIQAAFVLPSLPRDTGSSISINLPLLNPGLTFTLSASLKPKAYGSYSYKWNLKTFAFRQGGNTTPWKKTFMRAQLSLARDPDACKDIPCSNPHHSTTDSNSTLLGVIEVVLADNPSAQTPIQAPPGLSLQSRTKVWLHVSISECPFSTGLFQITSSRTYEGEAHTWLVRQCGDHLLDQSLATGKIYDVKFLTSSSDRSTSGEYGKLFEIYASLSVLEKHINLTSTKISEGWTNALAALGQSGNADAKHAGEILCPNGYEYELDSDFDEDEASPSVEPCASSLTGQRDLSTLEGQQSESKTERTSGSFSSYGLDGASDRGSVDSHIEEFINDMGEPPHSFSMTATDNPRTIAIKFAAHRTWRAFLWYCYTSRLEFSKLKSQAEPGTRLFRAAGDGIPTCSPKSMYRLANLIGDVDLKAKALAAIRERMTEANVLDELFSVFTSNYPEVREVQLDALMRQCQSPEVKKAFLRMMLAFGSMPHAKPTLEAIYDRLVA